MNITIEHLRCFQMVAQMENFSKAAAQLYMTQPSLSRMMASLEKEWDVALFIRTTRSVRLTPEGRRCLESAEKILEEYAMLEKKLRSMRHLRSGDLNIGYNSPSEPPVWFSQALFRMRDHYPSIHLSVKQNNTQESVKEVQNGDLDCAMVFEHKGSMPDDVEICKLDKTARYAMLPSSHPLAESEKVHISDLEGETLVVLADNERLTRTDLHTELKNQHINVARELEVRSITGMAFQVVLSGAIGITALIDSFSGQKDIVFREIPELTHDDKENYRALIWKKDNTNPSIRVFTDLLTEELSNYQKQNMIYNK